MDFFDRQQRARRATRLLSLLFLLALLLLAALVNMGFFLGFSLIHHLTGHGGMALPDYLSSSVCMLITGTTLALFSCGSLRRWWQLRHHHLAIATLLNADEVTFSGATDKQKQYINVAEEMAIVSGHPVPRLFLLPNENGINAFVAGSAPEQLLVVTQGALEHLTRDELQGIIGHEFSHLLNEDSRVNVNMLAWLAGLSSITYLGKRCLNAATPKLSSHQGSRTTPDSLPMINPALLLLGMLLCSAGYSGLILARTIKAAISRQREALADASALQFTRHPHGLGNALIKIKQHGSVLRHPLAEDINHMCFADSISLRWRRLQATHPDIDTRLQHISPGWLTRAKVRLRGKADTVTHLDAHTPLLSAHDRQRLSHLPIKLQHQLHQPEDATLVIYALLMSLSEQQRLPAINTVQRLQLLTLNEQLAPLMDLRLALIDIALPALQRLSANAKSQLIQNIDWLIRLDGEATLSKYLLRELVRYRLNPPKPAVRRPVKRLDKLAPQIQCLLSRLIHAAAWRHSQQQRLFLFLVAPLLPSGYELLAPADCSLKQLASALKDLRQLGNHHKWTLMQTCQSIIIADNRVTAEEVELLRLICLLADAPLPRFRASLGVSDH